MPARYRSKVTGTLVPKRKRVRERKAARKDGSSLSKIPPTRQYVATYQFVAAERRNTAARRLHGMLQEPDRGGLSAWAGEQLTRYFSKKTPEEKVPKLEDLVKSEPKVEEVLVMLLKEEPKGGTSSGKGEGWEKFDTLAAVYFGISELEKEREINKKDEASAENVGKEENGEGGGFGKRLLV